MGRAPHSAPRRNPAVRLLSGRALLLLVASGILSAPRLTADQTVNVGPGLAFSPSTVTVAPGETVTWVFVGVPHSTTSNATSGPEFWDSGVVGVPGTAFSHTFTTPGTYPYYCLVHSSPTGTTMNGIVGVVPPPTPTPTPTVVPTATPTSGPAAAPVPVLDARGLAALAVGLLAAALLLLSKRGR